MSLLNFDKGLKQTDPELMRNASITHRGQAHFAGTGPKGKTCADCAFWVKARPEEHGRRCDMARRFQQGQWGTMIPGAALACKHFAPGA